MAKRKVRDSHKSSGQSLEILHWAREVLLRIGIDASSDDARRWLPKMTKEIAEISDEALATARRKLKAEASSRSYETMAELRYFGASLLLDDPIGRQALRKAMKTLPPEHLLEVLDYRSV